MTQPAFAITPAAFSPVKPAAFITTNATVLQPICDPVDYQAQAAVGTLPPYYGGATLLDATVSSSDATPRTLNMFVGQVLTEQDDVGTGTITLTAQNKLTRSLNSWITDGWKVGDSVCIFCPRSASQVVGAVDGIVGIVSAVTAGDLTVSGTPWAAGANVLTAGTRVASMAQLFTATIPANAGTSAAVPNVGLLGSVNDAAAVRTEFKLGPDTMLAANCSAVSALPAQIAVAPRIARY